MPTMFRTYADFKGIALRWSNVGSLGSAGTVLLDAAGYHLLRQCRQADDQRLSARSCLPIIPEKPQRECSHGPPIGLYDCPGRMIKRLTSDNRSDDAAHQNDPRGTTNYRCRSKERSAADATLGDTKPQVTIATAELCLLV
jgi:hypothetical protein